MFTIHPKVRHAFAAWSPLIIFMFTASLVVLLFVIGFQQTPPPAKPVVTNTVERADLQKLGIFIPLFAENIDLIASTTSDNDACYMYKYKERWWLLRVHRHGAVLPYEIVDCRPLER